MTGPTQRRERGQIVAIALMALVGFMGFAAFTTDLGIAWYAKRQLQASVDAAALAGAQDLPDLTTAAATATSYAGKQPPRNATVDTPTITTKCTAAAAACDPANAVVVKQVAHVKTTFLRLFGKPTIDVGATATACQPCGTAPFDVMVAMDRSGSMCDASSSCTDLNNAKNGVRTLLQLMEPSLDR